MTKIKDKTNLIFLDNNKTLGFYNASEYKQIGIMTITSQKTRVQNFWYHFLKSKHYAQRGAHTYDFIILLDIASQSVVITQKHWH